jgi:hypothetical protein
MSGIVRYRAAADKFMARQIRALVFRLASSNNDSDLAPGALTIGGLCSKPCHNAVLRINRPLPPIFFVPTKSLTYHSRTVTIKKGAYHGAPFFM